MFKKFNLFLVIFFIEVKCVEWHKNAIFYSMKMENFKKSSELSYLKKFGVKALILKDVVKGECFDENTKALLIDELIVSTHEYDLKVIIDLRYFLTIQNKFFTSKDKEAFPRLDNIDLSVHYQNTVNELKVVMTQWISRGVDGFKVEFEAIAEENDDRTLLNIFINDLEIFLKEWSDNEEKIFMIETSDTFSMSQTPLKNSSYVIFFLNHPNNYESNESSNRAWILQILLPGFVVLDESINIEEYSTLLALRKHETVKNGNVQTINLKEDVLVLKRELEGYETFAAVINLGPEKITVDFKDVFEFSGYKIAAVSSGSSYQIE